jgi:hypothetical protein
VLRIGTLASRFRPLVLLPCHQSTGSCSSAQKPASDSRPLYADRHLPSHQASDRLIPEEFITPGFDGTNVANDASSTGSLSFVFRIRTCSGSRPELLLQRSPPWSFATAAWSGLGPAPESRSRGAYPHLSRSFTTSLWLASFHSVSAAHRTSSAADLVTTNTFQQSADAVAFSITPASRWASCKSHNKNIQAARYVGNGARRDRTS